MNRKSLNDVDAEQQFLLDVSILIHRLHFQKKWEKRFGVINDPV